MTPYYSWKTRWETLKTHQNRETAHDYGILQKRRRHLMSWLPCCRIVPTAVSGCLQANLDLPPLCRFDKAVYIPGNDRLPQGSSCGRKGTDETHKGKAKSSNLSCRDLHSILGMKKVLRECEPTVLPHYHSV